MTEVDKQVLKSQLSIVQGLLASAKASGSLPITTPTGPAVAPGIGVLAQSLSNAVEQLTKVLEKVIEKS